MCLNIAVSNSAPTPLAAVQLASTLFTVRRTWTWWLINWRGSSLASWVASSLSRLSIVGSKQGAGWHVWHASSKYQPPAITCCDSLGGLEPGGGTGPAGTLLCCLLVRVIFVRRLIDVQTAHVSQPSQCYFCQFTVTNEVV